MNEENYIEENIDLKLMNRVLRHRLRNLCAGVKMTSERISKTIQDTHPRMSARCDIVVSELDNLEEFTQRLDLVFDTLPNPSSLSLFEIINMSRLKFVDKFPFSTLELYGEELKMDFKNGNLIQIVVEELLMNAGDATIEGRISLNWKIIENELQIWICNDAQIPKEIPIDPPQPFNTNRGKHDGIGLAIAHRIIESIGSEFKIENKDNEVLAQINLKIEEI